MFIWERFGCVYVCVFEFWVLTYDTITLITVFFLKLKISITTELIEFSFLGKLHIGSGMVLGYFIFRFKPWDGFRLSFAFYLFIYRVSRF